MPATVQGAGALLDTSDDESRSGELVVEVELFAEVNGQRWGGQYSFVELEVDRDPTNQLIDAAEMQRELNLGGLLGDMRRMNIDVTRFEVYSAPFRVELTDRLRERLADLWDVRPPRPDAWTWPPR